jgi:hypothetical protein
MTEVAKDAILAFGDSQMLRNLYELGSRGVRIAMAQNQENFQAGIQSETESENKAGTIVSALNMALKFSKPKEGSDEAILMRNAQVSAQGKTLIINFSISNEEKNQMIEKNLQRLREKSKNR